MRQIYNFPLKINTIYEYIIYIYTKLSRLQMSRLFPIPKLDTKFDSYIGKATFHWNKEEFLTIMK